MADPPKSQAQKNPTQEEQASLTIEALMAEMSRVDQTLQKCLLEDARITNEQGAISSTMEEKIKLAVAAAMSEVKHTPNADVRALREQTLVNINVVYDIFNSRPDGKLSALKFITTRPGPYFSASVIRTQLDPTKSARPAIIIQADDCDSSDEAVEKLYKFSQAVLNRAWELSEEHEAYFDVWSYLFSHDSGDWWDKGCTVGAPP